MFRFSLTLSLLLLTLCLTAQRLDYVQGELLVRIATSESADTPTPLPAVLVKDLVEDHPELTDYAPLNASLALYRLTYDHARHDGYALKNRLWQDDRVETIQFNHRITFRRAPNDTRYPEQWSLNNVGQLSDGIPGEDINVEPAWDVTTGGVTANGDTIVVAVLDDGTDLDHEDLLPNLWRNHDEIPGNNLDDDNNGYVDDYFGYDTNSDDGDPGAGSTNAHGTPVAGIIGARGNNNLGVTGVNWNVKLLTVRNGFLDSEAEVIQAYGYVIDARREYDRTGGAGGAYVVATNASWGREFGRVEDSPIWCGLYDTLGTLGIINLGAVTNALRDVDILGDLPTNCPSDYLIGVTQLETDGNFPRRAGFGTTSVDLAAYGTDVFTTTLGNGYGRFGGTSAATPHVTGAAALLFSAPCSSFAELLAVDPAAAALLVREVLLTTTRSSPALDGRTATGGVLDVGAAMNELMSRCSDCLIPTSFRAEPPPGDATALTVSWNAIASLGPITLRYRVAGTTDWTELPNVTSPQTISGLPVCAGYEFQLTGSCGDAAVSTEILTAFTDGCCQIPDDWKILAADGPRFFLDWTDQLAARFYQVRYRPVGDTTWQTRTTVQPTLGIASGLTPCTDYEFEFLTDCDTSATGFGQRMTVRSRGCGACLELDYCAPNGYDNTQDWIERVDLAGLGNNRTGRSLLAYNEYGEITESEFVPGGVYPVRVTAGARSATAQEVVRLYADWDHNGFFSSTELVGEVTGTAGDVLTIGLTVPPDADPLLTRLRVAQQFFRFRGGACSITGSGEVEDYCIQVAAGSDCGAPRFVDAEYDLTADATLVSWSAAPSIGNSYRLRYRLSGSADAWSEIDVAGLETTVEDLNLCGRYDLQVRSICNGAPGAWSRVFTFADDCTNTRRRTLSDAAWQLFPNPSTGHVSIRWQGARSPVQWVEIRAMDGRSVGRYATGLTAGIDLPLPETPPGIYLVRLLLADGTVGVRRLVIR